MPDNVLPLSAEERAALSSAHYLSRQEDPRRAWCSGCSEWVLPGGCPVLRLLATCDALERERDMWSLRGDLIGRRNALTEEERREIIAAQAVPLLQRRGEGQSE